MRSVFTVLFSLVFLTFFQASSFGSENFSTSYVITYTLTDNGQAHSAMDVSVTNKTTDYYASSYTINLGFENVTNLKAFDSTGELSVDVKKSENGYSITIPFNSQVVGFGKKRNFTISFDTNEIAKKQGSIWEVNIPGLSDQESISDFTVHLSYPSSYGKPAYVKPFISLTQDKNNSLTFSKEQLGKSGISISFGASQIANFSLKYHIKNTNLFPIKTEIAIPPTTQYQEIVLNSMDPLPIQVTIDQDGNWLAQYYLSPSESKDITVKGSAILLLTPRQEELTEEEKKLYTSEKKYWNVSDPEIQKNAKDLKTPKDIYNYVVNKLSYDYSRVTDKKERLGAKNVLANPTSAVCLEFTDLFITLARANGIPAREVDGFAFTENSKQRPLSLVKDILHAWPEYYDFDKKAWIMVDPTWGNTTGGTDYFDTLDFDHFAFVKKGKDSMYPIPAGGYKYLGTEEEKDIQVEFSETFPTIRATTKLSVKTPTNAIAGFPITGNITIVNTGNVLSDSDEIVVFSSKLLPKKQIIVTNPIPPFGHIDTDFSFKKTSFLTSFTDTITIQSHKEGLSRTIHVAPIFLTKEALILGGVLLVIFIITISIVTIVSRRVSVSRRK